MLGNVQSYWWLPGCGGERLIYEVNFIRVMVEAWLGWTGQVVGGDGLRKLRSVDTLEGIREQEKQSETRRDAA